MRVRNQNNTQWVVPQSIRVRNAANTAWEERCIRIFDGSQWRDALSSIVLQGGSFQAIMVSGFGPTGAATATYGLNGQYEFATVTEYGPGNIVQTRQVIPETGGPNPPAPNSPGRLWRRNGICPSTGDYEVALIGRSGSDANAVTGPGLFVWNPLISSNIIWSLSAGPGQARSATLNVAVRRVGTTNNLATSIVNFFVSSEI